MMFHVVNEGYLNLCLTESNVEGLLLSLHSKCCTLFYFILFNKNICIKWVKNQIPLMFKVNIHSRVYISHLYFKHLFE